MRRVILITALLFTCLHVYGQDIKVELSDFFKLKNGKGFLIPVKGDSTGYYTLTCDTFEAYKACANTDYVITKKLHGEMFAKKFIFGESVPIDIDEIFSNLKPREIPKQKLYLVKFDKNMKFLWKKEVSYKNDYFLVNIIPTEDKMYFFFKTWNKTKKASALYYTYLKTRNSLASKYVQIDTIPLKNKNWEEGSFRVLANEDNSRIVTFNQLPEGNYKKGIYNITMFDEEMKKVWKKTVDFDFPGKYYSFRKVLINRDRVFFLTKVKKKNNAPYAYAIFIVGKGVDEDRFIYLPISSGKIITGVDMKFDNDGNIKLTGFYSSGSYENPEGVFTYYFNTENLDMSETKDHEFDDDDFTKNDGNSFQGLHFRDFYLNSDGSQTVVAEYYNLNKGDAPLKLDKTGNYPYQSLKKVYLQFGDIVVMNLDKEASVSWLKNIQKSQTTNTVAESSFSNVFVNDSLYIFCNETDVESGTGTNAVCYMVSPGGKIKDQEIINSGKSEVTMLPKIHFYKHERELVFFLYKKKEYKLAKVTL